MGRRVGQEGGASIRMPLADVPGISPGLARDIETLGPRTAGGLVAYLPRAHERLEPEGAIATAAEGRVVTVRGEIVAARVAGGGPGRRPVHGKSRFEAILADGTGRLVLVWFNAPYMKDRIRPGVRVRVQGECRHGPGGMQMVHPRVEYLGEHEPEARSGRVRPVYPASEKVASWRIELAVRAALPMVLPLIEDHLDESFRRERELPALADAYRMMHAPVDEGEARSGRRRLAYDELLLLQVAVQIRRGQLRRLHRAPALAWNDAIRRRVLERFPFRFTAAQDRVLGEVASDLSRDTPANRLIQGDVGSGKTAVAVAAMLVAAASGRQAALMAPTEVLAMQHADSIARLIADTGWRSALLTGGTPEAQRRATLDAVRRGTVHALVGTHALLEERVSFKALAVAIIDEQHRFGVRQRAALRGKGGWAGDDPRLLPHVLVMTATPIPRTLAITLFGDLDVSTIDELPAGRKPVRTRVVGADRRAEVYARLRARLEEGRQAYIVVPAIEGGAAITEAPAPPLLGVRELLRELASGPLAGLRLGAMHARLPRETRDRTLREFREGRVDALVTTTVIEVGLDVPNASIMVVEQADRFGLSQLHQLRGRVGRGESEAACILIAHDPSPEAMDRLGVVESTRDGFVLAQKDLELRGPGVLFGAKQSGLPDLGVADLGRDLELLAMARRDAETIVREAPVLLADKPPEGLPANLAKLRQRVLRAHGKWLGLGDVG